MKKALVSKNTLGLIFLTLWGSLVVVVITLQMASHSLSMQLPNNINQFMEKIISSHSSHPNLGINVHVVYEHCSCTNLLLKHLADRGIKKDSVEIIMVLGRQVAYEDELKNAGFIIEKMDRDQFVNQFKIEAVPLLLVLDKSRQLRYMGGYFETSEAKVPMDESIIRDLALDKRVEALPLYGCAISQRLRNYTDPFGLSEMESKILSNF